MSKHHFIETRPTSSTYDRLIYCDWCGIVVWNNNANANTTPSIKDIQAQAGHGCKANDSSGENKTLTKASQDEHR